MSGDKILDKVTVDEIMKTLQKQWLSIDDNTTRIGIVENKVDISSLEIGKTNDNAILLRERIRSLVTQENKNSEHIKSAQEHIRQLYLLFNDLIRSNNKEKDDG